jgi:arylsulfatase A-like enzyme
VAVDRELVVVSLVARRSFANAIPIRIATSKFAGGVLSARVPWLGARCLPRLLAPALCAFALEACRGAPKLPEQPNFLLLMVDTLRSDRLSLHDYPRQTSPQLDRFAAERAVVFDNAWANAGCTFPSVASILTGAWPQLIVATRSKQGTAVPTELRTLAERFSVRGGASAAVSASPIVRRTPSTLNPKGGYERGFAAFDETCEMRPASCVNRRALQLLNRLPEPFFLYLHYMEPHAPYRPPPGAARNFSKSSRAKAQAWARAGDWQVIRDWIYERDRHRSFGREDVRHLSDLYDDEVRYWDSEFGELITTLDARGVLGRTVVVVIADHGEELFDHQEWSHCRDMTYETVLATPLVMAVPGIPPARRSDVVSNVDLAPTLLELAGLAFDPADFAGRSLVPLLVGEAESPEERYALAAQGVSRAATDGRRIVRFNLRDGSSEASALARGGLRATPVDPSDPDVTRMRRALIDWIRRFDGDLRNGESVRRADELERRLKELGYL